MINRLFNREFFTLERLWSEAWNLFKFGVVGITSLAIDVGAYTVLSRFLWIDGSRTLQSVIATSISAIYNFTLHRRWTFGARTFNVRMVFRYIFVIALGTALNGLLFYIGHEVLHLYDIAVKFGVVFLMAGISYSLHRWYTFHPSHDL